MASPTVPCVEQLGQRLRSKATALYKKFPAKFGSRSNMLTLDLSVCAAFSTCKHPIHSHQALALPSPRPYIL